MFRPVPVLLFLFLTMAITGFSQSVNSTPAFFGNWRGSVIQPGYGSYIAEMSFNDTNGTVEYPSLRCGGIVTMLNNSGNEYQYAEHITHGRCIDGGIITAKIQGHSMEWDWSGRWQGRPHTVKGVLEWQPENLSNTNSQSTDKALAGTALSGNWRGSVYQPGRGSYIAQMYLHDTNGTVEYPSLRCGGTVTMLENSGIEYRYAEHFTYGNHASGGNCIDEGIVTAKVQGDSMDFETSGHAQGRTNIYSAKGLLTRQSENLSTTSEQQPAVPTESPPQNTLKRITARIKATALGKEASEGETLRLKVPERVGLEVTFVASIDEEENANKLFSGKDTALSGISKSQQYQDYRYLWSIDDGVPLTGKQLTIWLSPAPSDQPHKVDLRVNKLPNTPLLAPVSMPPVDASIKVLFEEQKEWNCMGRLGKGCNDSEFKDNVFTTHVDVVPQGGVIGIKDGVEVKCDDLGNGQICIKSKMSLGAIRHDRCCGNHESGYGCNLPLVLYDISMATSPVGMVVEKGVAVVEAARGKELLVCEYDWKQAKEDIRNNYLFDYTWKYTPDPNFTTHDPASIGDKNEWWKGLVPAGTVISRGATAPSDEEICESKKAEPRQILMNTSASSNSPGYPPLSATIWVCSAANQSGETIPLPSTSLTPQGKIDPIVNNVIPSVNLKAKAAPPAGCNNSSNTPVLGNGGAQGALKKFGSSKGGC